MVEPSGIPHTQGMKPDLSVIVLSWNTSPLLRKCLSSLRGNVSPSLSLEIIVVDNASSDGSADMVASEFTEVLVVRNEKNEGYASGNNQGARISRGECILFLNSDTEVLPNALERMVAFLRENRAVGGVGCKLLNPDGTIQKACMRFPILRTILVYDTPIGRLFPNHPELRRYYMRDWDHGDTREVEQPPGACFMVRRDVLDRVGALDEEMFLFFNDVDFCRRIKAAGYKIFYLAEAPVIHHCGASTGKFIDFGLVWHKNRIAYYRKHHGGLAVALCKTVVIYVALREMFLVFWKGIYKKKGGGLMRYILRGCWEVLRA